MSQLSQRISGIGGWPDPVYLIMRKAPPTAVLRHALDAEMGLDVRRVLERHARLPARGVAAGQSVASALFELYGLPGVRGPYNDVDVFVVDHGRCEALRREQRTEGRIAPAGPQEQHFGFEAQPRGLSPTAVAQAGADYFDAMTHAAPYRLVGARRSGRLNTIGIATTLELAGHPLDVVSAFDLNGVQVALDLSTNQLWWNEAFEHFVQTAALVATPCATAV